MRSAGSWRQHKSRRAGSAASKPGASPRIAPKAEGGLTNCDSARLFDPSCRRAARDPSRRGQLEGDRGCGRAHPCGCRRGWHDALNGVALTARNSHRIHPRPPGCPGGAAHGSRGRYLAKEWVGSNRLRQERLQLPAATTTESKTNRDYPRCAHDPLRPASKAIYANTPALPLRKKPGRGSLPLDRLFQERAPRPEEGAAGWRTVPERACQAETVSHRFFTHR
jgi:hypothetical protein